MKKGDFKNSTWYREAGKAGAESNVIKRFPKWANRVKNTNLLGLAGDLKNYLVGGHSSLGDKTLVIAGLLYLISPLDLIPDAIPVLGWLDDIGVATFVLSYLKGKLREHDLDEEIQGTEKLMEVSIVTDTSVFETKVDSGPTLAYKIKELRETAHDLNLPQVDEAISDIESDLLDPLHKVLFFGRYNVGKSSLINALLGKKYLREGAIPTTKTLHSVMYGRPETVCVQSEQGELQVYRDLSAYEASVEPSKIAMFVDVDWLSKQVCLIDTPGIGILISTTRSY